MRRRHKTLKYGMKAAPLYSEQLSDRFSRFADLPVKPVIELHLFGRKDVFDEGNFKRCVDNCLRFNAVFYVHFPILDPEGFGVYDPARHEDSFFEKVVDFSRNIDAKGIIMHRVYGVGMGLPRQEAVSRFNRKVLEWAKVAYPTQVYFENYSLIWLPDGFAEKFVVSPLDHFFPWEIREFRDFIKENKINNASVMIDVAHTAISSNMFNFLRYNRDLGRDPRFANILPEDLDKSEFLKPGDFLTAGSAPYLHVSDSFLAADIKNDKHPIERYLFAEGLPLGSGNLLYQDILKLIPDGSTLIMEINPVDGDHNNAVSQYEGMKYMQECLIKCQV